MKQIEIITAAGDLDTVSAIAEQYHAQGFRIGQVDDDGLQDMRMLITDDYQQQVLDALQTLTNSNTEARIVVLPIEISLPQDSDEEREREDAAMSSREALYDQVEKNARTNQNYLILLLLSTVVAAIGLLKDNVAVIIGAMVIAPLLGPNLALGLSTSLGDLNLMRRALVTLLTGIVVALALSIGISWGYQWLNGPMPEFDTLCPGLLAPGQNSSGFFFNTNGFKYGELCSRTVVDIDAVVLALASGAAAALSLTTGLSSVLVGVMVAVALLPPATTVGVMISTGSWTMATGAALLLLTNIVCVNLTCKVVFLLKGIRPRHWLRKRHAQQTSAAYIVVWAITLALILGLIFSNTQLG